MTLLLFDNLALSNCIDVSLSNEKKEKKNDKISFLIDG